MRVRYSGVYSEDRKQSTNDSKTQKTVLRRRIPDSRDVLSVSYLECVKGRGYDDKSKWLKASSIRLISRWGCGMVGLIRERFTVRNE